MSRQVYQCGCGARQTFEDIQYADRFMNHINYYYTGEFEATCLKCYRVFIRGKVENVDVYIQNQMIYKRRAK